MTSTQDRPVAETRFAGVARDPEALDQVVGVTPVRGWIALGVVVVTLAAALIWSVTARVPQQFTVPAVIATRPGPTELIAGATGSVEKLLVEPGDAVAVGDDVATIRTLEGDVVTVEGRADGVVRELLVEAGQGVEALDAVAVTSPTVSRKDDAQVVTYVSALRAGPYFNRGDTVHLVVPDITTGLDQALAATVSTVADTPSSLAGMTAEIGDADLAEQLFEAADGQPYRVGATISWSAGGADLSSGQVAEITVVYANPHPIDLLFGGRR